MFKRILVPLDGSQLAEKVLPFTQDLAKQLQATLILFHVVEKNAPDEIHGQHHLHEISEVKTYLSQVAGQLSSQGLSVLQDVHEVQEVGVAQTIYDHAEELQADLIVLCAHGNGGLRNMLFGSIAQQVIRQGHVPVLFIRPETVREGRVGSIRHILIPLDGLRSHETALPVASFLAKQYQASLRLLTVIPGTENLSVREGITSRVSPRITALALDINAKQAEEYLRQTSQKISQQGISATGDVLRGDVPARMMEVIEKESINMVVMATHAHGTLDSRWEGSLTPRFLPGTPVPVLLVRSTEE